MIKPTVGRVVWFRPATNVTEPGFAAPNNGDPCAAMIVKVWGDRMVNLAVFDANGVPHAKTSVPLLQEDDERAGGFFCEWMPYQVGQAKAPAPTA